MYMLMRVDAPILRVSGRAFVELLPRTPPPVSHTGSPPGFLDAQTKFLVRKRCCLLATHAMPPKKTRLPVPTPLQERHPAALDPDHLVGVG